MPWAKRLDATLDRLVQETMRIATADIRDVVRVEGAAVTDEGEVIPGGVRVIPSDEWSDDAAAAVAEVAETAHGLRIKMHPKHPALDLLAKHLGIYKSDGVPLEEVTALVKALALGVVGAAKLVPQPHGGALARGGRTPGSKNKSKPARERVEAAAARKSSAALKVLDEVMRDPEQPGAVRIAAARAVLDRGIGRVREHDDGVNQDDAAERTQRLFGAFASGLSEEELAWMKTEGREVMYGGDE